MLKQISWLAVAILLLSGAFIQPPHRPTPPPP